MFRIDPVTLSEAEFLTGRPEKEINRVIDRGVVDKITETVRVPVTTKAKAARSRARRGKPNRTAQQRVHGLVLPRMTTKTVRKLGAPELLFLTIENELHDDLTPAGRKKLYTAIKAKPAHVQVLNFGPFEADVGKATKALVARIKALQEVRKGIVARQGEDPVIKGTGISVYRVAALAQGQSIEEILQDFPSLDAGNVERAVSYATAYPKVGRPYPTRSFARSAGALADMGAFGPSEHEA